MTETPRTWNPNAVGATAQQDADQQYPTRPTNNYVASAARTGNGNGTTVDVGQAKAVIVDLDVTAVSGTSPSMVLELVWSNDGTNWYTSEPYAAFTAVTAAKKVARKFDTLGRYCRAFWTITGTTPSFTFAAHLYYQDN